MFSKDIGSVSALESSSVGNTCNNYVFAVVTTTLLYTLQQCCSNVTGVSRFSSIINYNNPT